MSNRNCAAVLFVIVFFAHALSPVSASLDSVWTIPVALNLLDHGTTHVDEYLTLTKNPQDARLNGLFLGYQVECVTRDGKIIHVASSVVQTARDQSDECWNGHYFNWYPVAVPVLAAPILFTVRHTVRILSPLLLKFANHYGTAVLRAFAAGDFVTSRTFTEVVVASIIVALTTVVNFFIARLFLPLRTSVLFALVFAFATSAWSTASRGLWQHGPSMLMLSISLYLLLLARDDLSNSKKALAISLVGVTSLFAYVIRPTNALWVCGTALYILFCHRRYFLWFVAGTVPVATAFLLYNWSVYHRLLPTYFTLAAQRTNLPRDIIPIMKAMAGTLVSPARGLLIYSPVFLFSIWGMAWALRHRWCTPLATLLIVVITGNVLVLGYYHQYWWGGFSYGPRLLADVTPFLMFFLLPTLTKWHDSRNWSARAEQVTFFVLLCASVLVHGRGAYSEDVNMWNTIPASVDDQQARLWDWRDPPFLRGPSKQEATQTLTQKLHPTGETPLHYFDAVELRCQVHPLWTNIFCSRTFYVAGWANIRDRGTAAGVEIVLDNQLYRARYGVARPDVAAALKDPSYGRSGFCLSRPAGEVSEGLHHIAVRVIDQSQTSYAESSPAPVMLTSPRARPAAP